MKISSFLIYLCLFQLDMKPKSAKWPFQVGYHFIALHLKNQKTLSVASIWVSLCVVTPIHKIRRKSLFTVTSSFFSGVIKLINVLFSCRMVMIIALSVIITCFVLTILVVVCCFCPKCLLYDACRAKYTRGEIIAYSKWNFLIINFCRKPSLCNS